MKTAKELLNILDKEEFIEMETENDLLIIRFRRFFGTEKEFLFELNCKAVDSCKTKLTAIKKINQFINKGFEL